ncbi:MULTISPECIES: NAD(P)/FAD-dependent oxidoreductase [Sulfurisphaera]|uniref:Oxidoreductase n=3 Tax=Sulfurisphaera TaxID=69655 RepID=Q974P4_SULTO|nr:MULTISPECIES: FAD/NAD(P)-binding oxidoreductase [Sulfurisphaera]MBB5252789.1 sulfide:quinone oxidoreductase [Sulfurisphaera ohwakuensis]QGR16270.1 NAD(P)/FAD-dependent oxidoreductase [Sulfurisphaera ohwakuensis]BAB65613.1 putative oxidoreductase [Sulfurisphaera tokodaii str. 7]HII74683.1 NAD(P)/FAD-dependent oxidoreductase [Sulfurisphaera tokodaii]
MKRVIIAGGNIAGTIVANRLAKKLDEELDKGEVEIVVLNNTDEHVYLPGQLLVAYGLENPIELKRKESELLDPRIKFLHGQKGTITKIDVANHSVITADGLSHSYDYLVITTGVEYTWDEVPGYRSAALSPYEFDGALKMREALEKFQGGTVVVNVAKLPHRCPVAPLEMTLILDDYLRKRGIRDKTKIIYTYPTQGVFGRPITNKFMLKLFEERGIEVHSPFNVTKVDPNEKIIESQEGGKIKFDLLLGVPPNMGAKVIEDSGIGDRRRWVPTDKFTLRMKDQSNVYVMGDATDLPVSKAGSTADFESYIVAHNIANDIKGNMGVKHYGGDVLCYIATGTDTATYIRFSYTMNENPPPPSYVHWWGKIGYNKLYWTVTAKAVV